MALTGPAAAKNERALAALRAGQPVLEHMVEAINVKPSGHELTLNHLPSRRCMIQIGG